MQQLLFPTHSLIIYVLHILLLPSSSFLLLFAHITDLDALHTQLKEVPMTDLLNELQGVTDWFTLGVWLDIPTPLLKAIRKDYTDTDQCRLEMLIAWSKQEVPTWPRVVCALGEMGMTELAIALAEKYGRIL